LKYARFPRLLATICTVALLLAACGGGDGEGGTQGAQKTPAQGGTLVVAAEQEPDCLEIYGSCSGSSWGYWVATVHTSPRAFDVIDNEYKPNIIMDGEPKLEPGPPQKVTYKIKKDAVWSDGQPITSEDIKFTWQDITTGKDIYSKSGYDKIKSIDTPDPQTAVATFSEPLAAWKDLFGAFYGIVPAHLLKGKDRVKELSNGYKWSGGPWIIDSWRKGQDLTLVPNPKYLGPKPKLDKVVFKFITDTAAELQAYKTGQVQAAYPQQQIGLGQQLKGLPDTKYITNAGTQYEGLWFNARKAPLDSMNVRKAVAYAVDRQAIVDQLSKPIKPDAQVLQSFAVPNFPQFYEPVFEQYKPDLAKVEELMKADGYNKGADGYYAKNGKRASIQISTTAGNQGRELVEQLLQSQLKEAGIELKVNNTKAGTLFGQWLPQGVHQLAMYAQVATPDPTLCEIMCADQIPGPSNNNSGQNFQFYGSPTLDAPWKAAEKELDEAKLADLVKQGNKQIAEEMPALPLYQKLTILVTSNKLAGPIGDNTTLGPFWNINEWGFAQAQQ
jgi:peptide/nickel transport system substrate-binding protein